MGNVIGYGTGGMGGYILLRMIKDPFFGCMTDIKDVIGRTTNA